MKKNKGNKILKRFLGILVISILVLIFILFMNTLRFESKQITVAETSEMEIDNDVIKHFSKAIQYKTISYEDRKQFDSVPFLAFIGFLEQTYPLVNRHLDPGCKRQWRFL